MPPPITWTKNPAAIQTVGVVAWGKTQVPDGE